MPTLLYLDQTYDCATAIKGTDYIHLLDDNGCMVASFDGISDFSAFTLQNGSYTSPTADHDCHIAVIRDDGTLGKGGHTCSGIASKNHTHTKSEIADFPTSMPASDVYSWAKASSKPTYTYSEVGAAASGHKHTKSEITDFPTSMTPTAHNHSAGEITSGTLAAVRGGTGSTALSSAKAYAIARRDSDANTLNFTSTANGAFYATSANGAPTFGTLPVAQGGTGVTSLSALASALGVYGKVEVVSYTGTGTTGTETSPVSVTFSFAPKFVLSVGCCNLNQTISSDRITYFLDVSSGMSATKVMMVADDLDTTFRQKKGFNQGSESGKESYGKKSADGKTFYWYNSYNVPANACNATNTLYYFVAFG